MIDETLSGRFRILRLLGRGGMSSVWWRTTPCCCARWPSSSCTRRARGKPSEALERFEREARTLAALTHPGIVTVIDRGEDKGRPYIVFEYVHGEDLLPAPCSTAGPCRSPRRSP